jgi:integration host factor subunit beta
MRKSTFIEKMVSKQDSLSQSDMELCVNHILGYLADALSRKGRIEIRGFGNLVVHYQAPREAQNPKTSEKIKVPGKYKIRFKMGKALKERLNP